MHMNWGEMGFSSEVATNWLCDFGKAILAISASISDYKIQF